MTTTATTTDQTTTATTIGWATSQEGTASEEAAFPRPGWATSSHYPEAGSHEGTVSVGNVTLTLGQEIPFTGEPTMIYVWLPEVDRLFGAQACRNLAVALMEAVRIIEAAEA